MFDKSTRSKQVCQLLLSLIVAESVVSLVNHGLYRHIRILKIKSKIESLVKPGFTKLLR